MRKKRNLDRRLEKCAAVLAAREGKNFYTTGEYQPMERLEVLFGNSRPVLLEIGCGKGKFAAEYALKHPEINLIAVEKLSNVIVAACENALLSGATNLKFVNCDAQNLRLFLEENSVDGIFLNFSCPYPKKHDVKKRLTSEKFVAIYKEIMKDSAFVNLKTDDVKFFEFSLESLESNGFEIISESRDMYAEEDVTENVATEYENRFTSQHIPISHLVAKLHKLP